MYRFKLSPVCRSALWQATCPQHRGLVPVVRSTPSYRRAVTTASKDGAQRLRWHERIASTSRLFRSEWRAAWTCVGASAAALLWFAVSPTSRAEQPALADKAAVAEHWQHLVGSKPRLLELPRWVGNREDQQFMWQTCSSDRGIKDCQIFVCDRDVEQTPTTGKTRICALLSVGDSLNGHVGLIHGGFSAALLDDLTGVATWLEKQERKMDSPT
eukprot:TRINITY_DN25036_c0_g1_i1.p1 TRINITY_DN25036_c0_g1~~TRINITY_DN25036_c0_g1_i1.p1  ORF type:complete len:214 (+),score=17.19 TRINITY_DN25036_c0_g1_i1:94-735(+)